MESRGRGRHVPRGQWRPASRLWSFSVLALVFMFVVAACSGGGGGSQAPSGGASSPGGGQSTTPEGTEGASPSQAASPTGTAAGSPSEPAGSPSEPAGSPSGEPSGEPSASASGGAASPGTGTTIQPPTANVQIDFWTPFTGADGDTMEELVNQYNSETPSVQISIQRLDEYYTQVNNAAAAGDLPEVMIMHIDQLALQAANNNLQPVTELVSQLGVGAEDFTEAVWNGTQWQGQQYSVPLDVHPATLYYNRELLEAAGVTAIPPTDQASFEDALTKCKAAGTTGPVWSNHFFSASLFWASLFYQGGGEWTNADYTQATFNSEAGVNASNYMRGLIDQGLHPQDVEADAEVSSFESGQSCMAITGIWQTNRFQNALGEAFGAGPIPQIFDQPGVWAGSHTLAIKAGLEGDELQGAYHFIDWLTGHTLQWAAGGQIPARVDVREDPAFAEIPDVPAVAEQVDAARFPPPIPGSADLLGGPGGVTEKLLETLTGGGDPKAGLDEAAETYTGILAESKEQYGF